MRIAIALIAAGLVASPALAQTMPTPSTTRPEASATPGAKPDTHGQAQLNQFVENAGQGNLFEIQSSNLALQKSQRQDVKQSAQQLVNDHTQAGDQLQQALGTDGPQPPRQLNGKFQRMMNRLKQASGSAFDRIYIQDQLQAHREAINLFRNYAQAGDNASVKQFAQTTQPVLERHLQMVTDLQRASTATASAQSQTNAGGGGNTSKRKH